MIRGFYKMKDDEILEYCFSTYGEDIGRGELSNKDGTLYNVLCERNLIGNLKLKRRPNGVYKNISDEELIKIFEEKYKDMNRKEIDKKDAVFMIEMRERELIDHIPSQIRDKGHHHNWEIFKPKLQKAIEKNNNEFPSEKVLRKIGMGYLSKGIRFHGGFPAVREKMGHAFARRPNGYLKNWENFQEEFGKIIDKVGHFPYGKELEREGYSSFNHAIKYHGGFPAVREKMGSREVEKPKGYWQIWENYEEKMLMAIKKNNGNFPTTDWLKENKLSSLVNSSKYHGGFPAVKERMGYSESEDSQLESLLEEYVGVENE